MDLAPARRREKWGWLPVLFLKSKGRSESLASEAADDLLDADRQSLLRLVAHMLPRCVPTGSKERIELEELSNRLEVLAGGLPEQEWAESLAANLSAGMRARASRASIRVSWG